MSDTKSWNDSFNYPKDKAVNPARACATYEQVEAQNRKNAVRYGWEDKPEVSKKYEGLRVKYRGETV